MSLLAALPQPLPVLIVARVLQGAWGETVRRRSARLRDELPPAQAHRRDGHGQRHDHGIGGGIGLVLTGLLTNHHGDYHRSLLGQPRSSPRVAALAGRAGRAPPASPPPPAASTGSAPDCWAPHSSRCCCPSPQGNSWGWTSVHARSAVLRRRRRTVRRLGPRSTRRVADPMVDMKVFVKRPVAFTNIAGVLVGVNMVVGFLAVSQFVQMPEHVAGYGFPPPCCPRRPSTCCRAPSAPSSRHQSA